MNEEKIKEIEDRVNSGTETEEDIEVLVDYFVDFMETLED
jgi:hypothetical protein